MVADHSDDNGKVGKGKPPMHSRWKPGQCGNPRGRPKGSLNFKTEVKRMLEAPIVVNENGKTTRVSTRKAALLRVREGALKGNHRFLSILLGYAVWVDGALATESPGDISNDDQAILDAYREEIRAETTKDNSESGNDDRKDS
jgi:hypothetical protein